MRFFALLLVALPLVLQSAEPYGAVGPFRVELLHETWHDQVRDRDVPVTIYWPSNATSTCPVILFSHGLGGTRDGYGYLGQQWASHGFVSIHLQHHGSDDQVWRGSTDRRESMQKAATDPLVAMHRPVDVSFAIDEATKLNSRPGPLKGRLDLAHVGVAGHSFGAWTALTIAGEKIGPSDKSYADERVKAAIALSAPVPRRSTDTAYGSITIPVLHMTGTADDSPIGDTSAKERRVPFDLSTNSSRYLITFAGGNHAVFAGPRPIRNNPKDVAIQSLIKAATTAFWDATLRSDADAQKWLDQGGLEKSIGDAGVFERRKPSVMAPNTKR